MTYELKLVGPDTIHSPDYQIAVAGPHCSPRIWGSNNRHKADWVFRTLPILLLPGKPFGEVLETYRRMIAIAEEFYPLFIPVKAGAK